MLSCQADPVLGRFNDLFSSRLSEKWWWHSVVLWWSAAAVVTRAKQAVVEFTGKGYPNWTHVGDKVVRIWKGHELAMSNSSKCKDNLNIRAIYGPAEKNQPKVTTICTSFSVLASQSVESSFAGKTKIQMLTTSCRSLTLPIHSLFKSLQLYRNNREIFLG